MRSPICRILIFISLQQKLESADYDRRVLLNEAPEYAYTSDDSSGELIRKIENSQNSNSDTNDSSKKCKCTVPAEIGEAIIRNQLRMDVFQNDQALLKDELRIRQEKIEHLTNEVDMLKEERLKVHSVVRDYQSQVQVNHGHIILYASYYMNTGLIFLVDKKLRDYRGLKF